MGWLGREAPEPAVFGAASRPSDGKGNEGSPDCTGLGCGSGRCNGWMCNSSYIKATLQSVRRYESDPLHGIAAASMNDMYCHQRGPECSLA